MIEVSAIATQTNGDCIIIQEGLIARGDELNEKRRIIKSQGKKIEELEKKVSNHVTAKALVKLTYVTLFFAYLLKHGLSNFAETRASLLLLLPLVPILNS